MAAKLTVCVGLMAAALMASCSEGETATAEPPVRPVKLVTIEAASNSFPVSYPAVIEAAQSTALTFQVGGLLQELPVSEGQPIEKGDLIARLDQRDFQNNFNSAKAQFDNAESEYGRALRLSEQNAISRSVLEQRRSARDVARAQFDTAKKALDDTELRAPFSGQIARVNVENFQNVGAQQTIAILQTAGDVEAVINVPAQIIAYIRQINSVDTIVTLDAAPGIGIPAEFKEASGQADPMAQSYRVRFSFTPPSDLLILPGMTGRVDSTFIYTGERINLGVAVPSSAILAEGDALYVWVVDEADMTVSKRRVEIGERRFQESLPVIAGLEGGELVVAAGAPYLHEGMRVRAWDPGA